MNAQRFVFTGQREVALETFDIAAPRAHEVLVKTHYTLMSTGTENIVFNRLFEAGTHWDNWVKYPFYPGYLAVGEVIAVGAEVTDRAVGQRVAVRANHASHILEPASNVYPVPDTLSSQDATWFGLAKIAFMGARASNYTLGGSLLIIGAGPIGQMTTRWAVAAGLEHIIVVDPVQSRLEMALRGGATAVISEPVDTCREAVLAAMGGTLPAIVNDSTGNAKVFAAALGLAAKFGRVVLLGDTGTPSGQHLTTAALNQGLTIVGAHDCHTDEVWNDATITRLFFGLAQRGKFDVSGLNTHLFEPEDVVDAYTLVNTRRGETMGVQFHWNDV